MQDQANNQNNTQLPNPPSAGQGNTPQQNTQSITPPATTNKEHEPTSPQVVEKSPGNDKMPEITQSEHPEVKIPEEIKNVAEQGPDAKEPTLPKDAPKPQEKTGQTIQTISTPSGDIKLPMTYTQAQNTKNSTKNTDSLHWLATLIMYQWRKYDPDSIKETK